ncbi:Antimicrobial peptide D2 [Bienertia sinuspersici]
MAYPRSFVNLLVTFLIFVVVTNQDIMAVEANGTCSRQSTTFRGRPCFSSNNCNAYCRSENSANDYGGCYYFRCICHYSCD